MKAIIEAEIRDFFEVMADGKLDTNSEGAFWDGDSNWGFNPAELAVRIERVLERMTPQMGVVCDRH